MNEYNKNINMSYIQRNILGICKYEYGQFLNKSNVMGVALGYKERKGFITNRECIKVFVHRKISKCRLYKEDIIPKFYNNIETDVVESAPFKLSSLTKRIRPVPGGYEVGPVTTDSNGTLSCVVTDGNKYFILASNHNIADENEVPLNTPVSQPSTYTNPDYKNNIIATLYKYIPITPMKSPVGPINLVDCAIAKINKVYDVLNVLAFVGKINAIGHPKLNQHVQKVGAESELTKGIVTEIGATIAVRSSSNRYLYKNQLLTTYMAQEGDSGAILLDNKVNALGLLLASSSTRSIFNDIDDVLESLKVKIITT